MPFWSDEARKAFFAGQKDGKNHSTTGQPFSSASYTLPKNNSSRFIQNFVNSAFERHAEGKKTKSTKKEAEESQRLETTKALEKRAKEIEKLKDEIRELQNGNISLQRRDELLNHILTKEKGSLPKETVEKLERQQQKLKERLEMQREEIATGKTNPIMPNGISTDDQKAIKEIDDKIAEIEIKEAAKDNPRIQELERKRAEEIAQLEKERAEAARAREEAEKQIIQDTTEDVQEIIQEDGEDIVERAMSKFDASVAAVAAASSVH